MGLDTHMIAGSRACSTPIPPTHPTITNQTSPHFAEALPPSRHRADQIAICGPLGTCLAQPTDQHRFPSNSKQISRLLAAAFDLRHRPW
jgi:hypothetical protein